MAEGINDAKQAFLDQLTAALSDQSFVKLTLGKFRGAAAPKRVVATIIEVKGQPRLSIVTSEARRDITKTVDTDAGVAQIGAMLGETAFAATLFTTARDYELAYNSKGEARLIPRKATYAEAPNRAHNRAKEYLVDPSRAYLHALGVTDAKGVVKPSMYAKFRQICHFVEIADDLIRTSSLKDKATLRVADIGAGKGYLTFALYDHLSEKLGKVVEFSGIERRSDLVTACNTIAQSCKFRGLEFKAEDAATLGADGTDVMIALHACDTATDDAILQGIRGGSELIIVAPCCQHELAPQITSTSQALAGLLKFGLFKQRQADLVTDAARCLLLQGQGYDVKVIEFVSTEHTAKNLLIAAVKSKTVDRQAALKEFAALKAETGFTTQRLETLLR